MHFRDVLAKEDWIDIMVDNYMSPLGQAYWAFLVPFPKSECILLIGGA